ncbi:MAG: phosphatidylserine/phosphatidylglycerophosphate/cardiolipin synthase family protein [Chloroflexota bacterium]|nr:phosphatidylserine/phosphatidylglycerophosphate/cardiolipin synthase family protein [Chloroflexota bacterium]
MRRVLRLVVAPVVAVVIGVALWLLIPPERRAAYPPPAGTLSATDAPAFVAGLASAERVGGADLAIPFAPSRTATFELLIDGPSFYPRILADIKAARSSVHVVQYGFRPGEVADRFVPVLKEKVGEGVAVRVIVDQLGSAVDFTSAAMFGDLVAGGVQVVRNDPLAIDRDGLLGDERPIDWRFDELAHLDHRKFFVIDGRVAWVGGAGIEDYFADGSFHDVYARVEGEAVGHVQAVFLTSFRLLGGPLPPDPDAIARLMPVPAEPGRIRTTVLHNVPAEGHLANTDAIELLIERAERRLDVIGPYSAERGIFERMIAAARRGVKVRFVVPAESNVWATQGALEHWYPDFQATGVELWEYRPLPHAKVVLADDRVLVGTTNLDAWALYRNWEVGLLFEDAGVAETVHRELFDRDVAASRPAEIPTNPLIRARNWLLALISPLL